MTIYPRQPEQDLYAGISPPNPNHPAFGLCPECGSSNTIGRDSKPSRVCLTCGFVQEFSSHDIAQTAWRPFYSKSKPPKAHIKVTRARLDATQLNHK